MPHVRAPFRFCSLVYSPHPCCLLLPALLIVRLPRSFIKQSLHTTITSAPSSDKWPGQRVSPQESIASQGLVPQTHSWKLCQVFASAAMSRVEQHAIANVVLEIKLPRQDWRLYASSDLPTAVGESPQLALDSSSVSIFFSYANGHMCICQLESKPHLPLP